MSELLDLRGRLGTPDQFAALGQALVHAFGGQMKMLQRDFGFFVFVDESGAVVGSLEFGRDDWHLRWPGPGFSFSGVMSGAKSVPS